MPTSRKKRRSKRGSDQPCFRGTQLTITYKGGIDEEKDRLIRKALGKYETGSGFSLLDGVRDHAATLPEHMLPDVLGELKKIRGVKAKKLVQKWVACR